MKFSTVLFILTVLSVVEIWGKDLYLITTPNALLSEAKHKFNVYLSTNAALVIETVHMNSKITNRTNIFVLEKGYHSILYYLPFVGQYVGSSIELRFLADNCTSITFCRSIAKVLGNFINETRQVDILINNFIIFSETDKPIYKPGDLIKLRAMAIYPTHLMSELPETKQYIEILFNDGMYTAVSAVKSRQLNFDSITIETPDNVKMAQWKNVSFDKAMKLTFQLSKDPMFGKWKVTTIMGSQNEIAYFTVKKYVLPRFVVDLYPPTMILLSDKNITFRVCASYSTGKNMQALMRGDICITVVNKICRSFASSLNGKSRCSDISIDGSPFGIGGKDRLYFSSPSYVTVTVIENGTTHEVTKIAAGAMIKYILYEIKFMSKKYFKPGLPYFGKIKLLRHDGTPKGQTNVTISVDSNFEYNWGFDKKYTSNNDGVVDFIIPYIPVQSTIYININGEENNNNVMLAPSLFQALSHWQSLDNEYIQISPLKTEVECPGTLTLNLLTNGDISASVIFVQMISRGVINKMLEYQPVPVKCSNRDDHVGHYECVSNNQLKCLDGWKGRNCREPICKGGCGKGTCTEPNYCICKNGWSGKFCEKCLIAPYCVNGYCKYGNDCQCLPGWQGYMCEIKGPIIHQYKNISLPAMTTKAPIKEPMYQNQTIFERSIDIPLDKNMGPDLHIVVYYINEGNEIVADSIEISKGLSNCSHLGGGKFEFNKPTANPKEIVKLSINPGTVRKNCALRISDVALAQFGQSSNINVDYLIEKLIRLNHKIVKHGGGFQENRCIPQRKKKRSMIYPGFNRNYDSRRSFIQSGLTPITNIRIINVKCNFFINYSERLALGSAPSNTRLQLPNSVERVYDNAPPKKQLLDKAAEIKEQIRDFFPETWLFDYYNVTPSEFNLTVPDSMTTWQANSFCMTEKGMWIAPSRYLTVVLPFFTDIYLPYSIKMDETLQLPVKLFNYIDDCYEIKEELKVNSSEIQVIGATSFIVCVCSNDVKTIYFNIKPKVMGKLNITIKAESKYSSFCYNGTKNNNKVNLSDAIRRQLLVEPAGIQTETTFSELICNNKEELGLKATYNIPTKIVPGSLRSYLIYNGDVMGQTFDNLDKLVKMPYGCGEQNMVALVPSIYVLDYLKNLNINDPLLINKAKGYILDGYKRQLTYKHDDGSYSAFGKSDKKGNTWLTAFVLKSFYDASKHVTISKIILKESVQYLEKMQSENGCFIENGSLLSNSMAGGLKNKGKTDESLLTAYVLNSLKNIKTSKTALNITRAIACMKESLSKRLSSYGLALLGYTLSIYEPQSVSTLSLMNHLQNISTSSGRYRYWKSGLESSSVYEPVNSADIETTGYALLALQNFQTLSESLNTIYWLSNQRNSLGGYYSTQDTIVALKAISVFAEKIGSSSFEKINLDVILDNDLKHKDLLTKYNRFVTRKVPLGSRNISYISLKTNGTGCLSIQLVSLYNIEKLYSAKDEFQIDVKASLTNLLLCTILEVKVCSSYLRKDKNSNMILITVDFPSGWEMSISEKNELLKQVITPLKRIDFMRDKVHLYYDSFSYAEERNERCFTLRLDQTSKIDNLKASFIRMVDYYQPEIYTDTSYEVPIKTCQITNSTKPKPPKRFLCPKCVNDTKESVYDFQSRICPWSFTGFIMAGNKTLKDRLFYETKYEVFYEWTVNLEPANCSCLKSWIHIKEDFIVLSSEWIMLNENLTFTNSSVLYPKNVVYNAFKSDLGKSCSMAKQLSMMMSRLLPDFKNKTDLNDTCPKCILQSNWYYRVSNLSTLICSNFTRWSLKVRSVGDQVVKAVLSNKRNETKDITATFPMETCFCLQQLRDQNKTFEILDINNSITTKKNLTIVLNNNFYIVEKSVFNTYKTVKCNN